MQNYRADEFLGILKPELQTETVKVPSSPPYYVPLIEFPLETVPSTVLVRDAASTSIANPDQDCSVLQATGANNNDPNVYVGRGSAGGGGALYRAFMRFDVAALPSSPSKVLLRLYLANINGDSPSQNVGVYRVTSSWAETGPTWAVQPTYDTQLKGQFAITPPTDGKFGAGEGYSGWFESDVTALYNQWKAGPNYGLMLRADESVFSYCSFTSSEGASPNVPQLVVLSAGSVFTQVGQSVTPGIKEFACAYSTGRLRFHSSAAGATLAVDYQGLGSPIDAMDTGLRGATTGTGSAYVFTTTTPVLLYHGLLLYIRVHVTSGANATLQVNTLPAVGLYRMSNSVQVGSSNLSAGIFYPVIYDATSNKFIVIGV